MAAQRTPGILYVTMQPKEGLPLAQFHDWYQNEHGPNRLRLPLCKNGFRYRAADLDDAPGSQATPEWMAVYDFDELESLTREPYLRLRSAPAQSQRERDTMQQIFVDRRSYDLLAEWRAADFPDLHQVEHEGGQNVMVAVRVSLQDGEDKEDELRRWYEEEHVALLQQVPGWRRTRRFVTSHLDLASGHRTSREFLALHEYAPNNGLGGEALQAATATAWCAKIYKDVVKERTRRVYHLYYTFGPAQRDLASLADPAAVPATFGHPYAIRTLPAHATLAGHPVIESFITTPDGVDLPYRLEGSPSPTAPLLVLSNSILVDYTIWDDFVTHFLRRTHNRYRVLRYNTRGRNPLPPASTAPITLDTLTADLFALLDALRAPTASLVGVSLGGATVLNAALTHAARIRAFVACDTNAFAPASNAAAWNDRVAVCESEALVHPATAEPLVGDTLAEATTRRWFVPASYTDPGLTPAIAHVKALVRDNSLQGFARSVHALHAYDVRDKMAAYRGKGAFLVGDGDGVLPTTMREHMADKLGQGAPLEIVHGAGHLPMVERPESVAKFVAEFLA